MLHSCLHSVKSVNPEHCAAYVRRHADILRGFFTGMRSPPATAPCHPPILSQRISLTLPFREHYGAVDLFHPHAAHPLRARVRRHHRRNGAGRDTQPAFGGPKTKEIDQQWLAGTTLLARNRRPHRRVQDRRGLPGARHRPTVRTQAESLAHGQRNAIQILQSKYLTVLGGRIRTADLDSLDTRPKPLLPGTRGMGRKV